MRRTDVRETVTVSLKLVCPAVALSKMTIHRFEHLWEIVSQGDFDVHAACRKVWRDFRTDALVEFVAVWPDLQTVTFVIDLDYSDGARNLAGALFPTCIDFPCAIPTMDRWPTSLIRVGQIATGFTADITAKLGERFLDKHGSARHRSGWEHPAPEALTQFVKDSVGGCDDIEIRVNLDPSEN